MKKLNASEMRAVDGGYSTTCPECGGKVSVSFWHVLVYGKKTAYANAQEVARAKHWDYSYGYRKTVKHY